MNTLAHLQTFPKSADQSRESLHGRYLYVTGVSASPLTEPRAAGGKRGAAGPKPTENRTVRHRRLALKEMTTTPPTADTATAAEPVPAETRTERVSRSIRIETEALIAAIVAGVLGSAFAAVMFWGTYTLIWAGWNASWSVGSAAMIAVIVLGLATCIVSYHRCRRLPEQLWRRGLPRWKALVDTVAVSLVHTALAVMVTGTVFSVAQLAFRRLAVGQYVGTAMVLAAVSLTTYTLYLSVAQLSTMALAHRLLLFMGGGVLLSMTTSPDPLWWQRQFSYLGTFGDQPSWIFNGTLIVAGVLVTTFAMYVNRDLRTLHDRGIVRYRWSTPTITVMFIVLGILLAGIGLVPENVTTPGHNTIAASTSLAFAALLLIAPVALRGMPWSFLLLTLGCLALLVGAVLLYLNASYFNLTAFEVVAFAILFGWIAVLARFMAAMLGRGIGEQSTVVVEAETPAP
jgi:hypothetical membrane protein